MATEFDELFGEPTSPSVVLEENTLPIPAGESSFEQLFGESSPSVVLEKDTLSTPEEGSSFGQLFGESSVSTVTPSQQAQAPTVDDGRDRSFSGAFQTSVDQPLENIGTSLKLLGAEGVGEWLQELTDAPENYASATEEFINKQGDSVKFGNGVFLRAMTEQAGQLVGSLATRVGGAAVGTLIAGPGGGVVGALAGPALFEAIQILGPTIEDRLRRDGREGETPTWEDWTAAAAAAGVSGLLNAIGVKNVGTLNKGWVRSGVGAFTKESITEATQSVVQEAGAGIGTEEGLQSAADIRRQAFAEGLLGGTLAGPTSAGMTAFGRKMNPPTYEEAKSVLDEEIKQRTDKELGELDIIPENSIEDMQAIASDKGYNLNVLPEDSRETVLNKLEGIIKEEKQREVIQEDAEQNVLGPLKETNVRKEQLQLFNSLTNEEVDQYIEQQIGDDGDFYNWATTQYGGFSFDPADRYGKEARQSYANATTRDVMAQVNLPSKYIGNDFEGYVDFISQRYDSKTLKELVRENSGISEQAVQKMTNKDLANELAQTMLELEIQQEKTAKKFTERSEILNFSEEELSSSKIVQRQITPDGNAISATLQIELEQGKKPVPFVFEREGAKEDTDLTLEDKLKLGGKLVLSKNQPPLAEKYIQDNSYIKNLTFENVIDPINNFQINSLDLELPMGTLPSFNKNSGNILSRNWARLTRPYGRLGEELGRRNRENITRQRALKKNADQIANEYEKSVKQVIKDSNGRLSRDYLDKISMAFLKRTGAKLDLNEEQRAEYEVKLTRLKEELENEFSEEGKEAIRSDIFEYETALEGIQKTEVLAQQLPEKMQQPLIRIRKTIDALSERLLDLPADLVNDENRITIQEGINRYVTRSFALFEPGLGYNPRFARSLLFGKNKKKADELYNKAVESIQSTNIRKGVPNYSRAKAERTVDEIIAMKNITSSQDLVKLPAIFKSTTDTLDLQKPGSIIESRGIIPYAIRELMGEIKDPAQVAATSISRLSQLVEQATFYEDVRQINERPGEMLFSPKKTGEYKYKIDTNEFNPLEDYYTTKEVAEVLGIQKDDPANQNFFMKFYDPVFLMPKALTQMGMIVLSPATQSRNFIGAGLMYLANGYIGKPGDFPAAREAIKHELFGDMGYSNGKLTDAGREAQKTFRRMQELGIVNTSVRLNDANDLFTKIGERSATVNQISHNLQAIKNTKPGQAVDLTFGKGLRGAQNLYSAADDFWKMLAFGSDRMKIKQMLDNLKTVDGNPVSDEVKLKVLREYGKNLTTKLGKEYKSNLDRTIKKSTTLEEYIDEVAAYHVRMGMPNYDYVGKFATLIRQLPFGNFIAFPTEILRTVGNLAQLSYKQSTFKISDELMTESNIRPEQVLYKRNDGTEVLGPPTGARPMLANGIQRGVVGSASVFGVGAGMQAFLQLLYDVDDEDLEAASAIGPKYALNERLAPVSKIENGKGDFLNLNYLLPYESLGRFWTTIQVEMKKGEQQGEGVPKQVLDGMVSFIGDYMSSYTDQSISSKVQLELALNQDLDTNRDIYNAKDNWGDILFDMMSHSYKSAAPGIFKQFHKVYLSYQEGDDRYDRYGKDTDWLEAHAKVLGLSTSEVDANKSFPFAVNAFKRVVDDNVKGKLAQFAYSLENITEDEILNEWEETQDIWYKEQQKLYFLIQNYEKMGIKRSVLNVQLKRIADLPGVSKSFSSSIRKGIFTPFSVPSYIPKGFRKGRNQLRKQEKEAGRDPNNITREWPTSELNRRSRELRRAKFNLTESPALPEIE